MKINDKHKYDVDIIEIKLFLDKITPDTFDNHFIISYKKIITASIGSLNLTKEQVNEIWIYKFYLSVLELDLKGNLFFALVSYQLIMIPPHRIQLVLDYHFQNTEDEDKFINQIEFFVLGQIEIYNESLNVDIRLFEIAKWVKRNRYNNDSIYNSSKDNEIIDDENSDEEDIIKDNRIDCNEDAEHIEEYFMELSEIVGKDCKNPIMTVEEVKYFLRANFKGFSPIEKVKKFKINYKRVGTFTYFIYEFFNSKTSSQRRYHKQYYIDLLFDNFTLYNDKERDNISSNFSRRPPKTISEK